MFDWDDIDEAIENDYEHAPYYVNPVYRSDDMPRDYSSITWNGSITETTTFEYRTTSRGTIDEYKCSCCGCYIYFPAYDTYASEKIDYDYCPYCGKPVAKE